MVKKLKCGLFLCVLAIALLSVFSCIQYVESESSLYDDPNDHYGKITVKNNSTYPITQLTIRETYYSSLEDPDIIIDDQDIPIGGSRSYGSEHEQMRIDLEPYDDVGMLGRRVWVESNGTPKILRVYISEGADVEVVLTDSGLACTDPVYARD